MAEPATLPDFSSTATYTAPGEPWDGDDTKVDPGAPIRALGFEPDLLPAPWLNYMLNLFGSWLSWFRSWHRSSDEEFIYPTTKTRKRTILPTAFGTVAAAGASTQWFPTTIGNSPVILPLTDGAKIWIPIDLPSGCTISAVEAIVRSSTARSSPNGWIVKAFEQSENWTTPAAPTTTQQGASEEGGLASGYSKISISSITPWIVVNEYTAHAEVTAPTGSLASTDALVAIRVTFTDGGPRNA